MGRMDYLINKLPRVKQCCCCCCDVRAGSLVVGWMCLIVGVIREVLLVCIIFSLVRPEGPIVYHGTTDDDGVVWITTDQPEPSPDEIEAVSIAQAVLIGICVFINTVFTVMSIVLLVGVSQDCTRKVKIWLKSAILLFITDFMVEITVFVIAVIERPSEALQFLSTVINYGILFHFLSVVKSYYVKAEEALQRGQNNVVY